MSRKKSNKVPLPILVLICACLLFAMYLSLSTLVLGLWGSTAVGAVDSYDSRLDDQYAGANRTRTISKGYYFTVSGKEYRGYVMYRGDERWPRLKEGETRPEHIRYLPFFPYINKPVALADFSEMGEGAILYHILSPIGCLFLLLLTTGGLKKKKKPKKAVGAAILPPSKNRGRDADLFCSSCGAQHSEKAAFCPNCGEKVQQVSAHLCPACGTEMPPDAAFCSHCGAAAKNGEARPSQAASYAPQNSGDTQRGNLIGFSEYHHHPEILAAAQKSRQNATVFMWIFAFIPLLGFPIAGLLMDDFPFGEAVVVGVCVALVVLTLGLLFLHGTKQPMWEGVVTNKFSKKKHEHRDDSSIVYTQYTVAITTDAGKKKTIVEKDSRRQMYDYLAVGDRVRYHPKFSTYEKYDKSKDRIIYCNVCSVMNPIQNDRCKRCDALLFK